MTEKINKGWPRNSSTGYLGGLSTAHGGGGGLSTAAGGGLSTGSVPYYSNIPPREVYLQELKKRGYIAEYNLLKEAWNLQVEG